MDAPLELASISGQNAQVCDAAVRISARLEVCPRAALVPWRETAISRFFTLFFSAVQRWTSSVGVAYDAGSR